LRLRLVYNQRIRRPEAGDYGLGAGEQRSSWTRQPRPQLAIGGGNRQFVSAGIAPTWGRTTRPIMLADDQRRQCDICNTSVLGKIIVPAGTGKLQQFTSTRHELVRGAAVTVSENCSDSRSDAVCFPQGATNGIVWAITRMRMVRRTTCECRAGGGSAVWHAYPATSLTTEL